MKQFPVIETKRLRLRAFNLEDVPRLVKLLGSKDISRTTEQIPHPYTQKDAIDWLSRTHHAFQDNTAHNFAIAQKETDELIGGMGLHFRLHHNKAEAGYWIGKPYWGQGYATEALAAVIQHGLETVGLNKIYAHHHLVNPASGKVMVKNGMMKEGVLKEHVIMDGNYEDVVLYGITKTMYVAGKEK